jgi:hypothetical protein
MNEDLLIIENFENEVIQMISELEKSEQVNEVFIELQNFFEKAESENVSVIQDLEKMFEFENKDTPTQEFMPKTQVNFLDLHKNDIEDVTVNDNFQISTNKKLPLKVIRNFKAKENSRKYRLKDKIVNETMEHRLMMQIELNKKLKTKIQLLNNLIELLECIRSLKS